MSEWGVRQEAERRGWPTSHGQLLEYESWGLLPERVAGRFPPETVDHLIAIHQARRECRPMCRRVLRLRAMGIGVWAPPHKQRQALAELSALKSFTARKRKLTTINRAFNDINTRLRQEQASVTPSWPNFRPFRPPHPDKAWTQPPPDDWRALIEDVTVSDDHIREAIGLTFHWDGIWRLRFPDVWPEDTTIPIEERIVIMVVRQLRIERGWRERAEVPAPELG